MVRTPYNTATPYTPGPLPATDLHRYLADELQRISASINSMAFGNTKAQTNPDGGFMVRLINKSGAATVKGHVVSNSLTAGGVEKIVIGEPDPIGVFYESGIPDGQEVWVVVSGIAQVFFVGAATAGHLARGFVSGEADYVSGQAKSEAIPTASFATDKHFYEIGHVIETTSGPGLAKCILHFN